MKLSIIIPVYNEEKYIVEVVRRVINVTLPPAVIKEIIIVDDGSTDMTPEVIRQFAGYPDIRVYYNQINMGKANAVNRGIKNATGDALLVQDADLEYCPDDYPALIEPIIQHKAQVVYGSRFKGTIKRMSLINRLANIISNVTINILFHTRLTDINTGYKVFRKEIINGIEFVSDNFAFETEVTVKLLRSGYIPVEVPISYYARTRKEGKKITWITALKMYFAIFQYGFKL